MSFDSSLKYYIVPLKIEVFLLSFLHTITEMYHLDNNSILHHINEADCENF